MARLLAHRIVIEPATFSFWCKSDAPLIMMKTTVKGLEGLANQLPCVMKFGGSSVASVDRMKEVAELILSFLEENPVIVLSAMGKTTNKLIAARENAASCISDVSEINESSFVKELHYR
ncbi:putative aspartate kinase [Helianthus anomalus]